MLVTDRSPHNDAKMRDHPVGFQTQPNAHLSVIETGQMPWKQQTGD